MPPRILFVDPSGWQGKNQDQVAFPNVGIAYLVGVLREVNHETAILDFNNEAFSPERAVDTIASFRPDVIGVSIKTATWRNARKIATLARERFPSIPLVAGGPHVSLMHQEVFEKAPFDVAVLGEAEDVIVELVARMRDALPVEDLDGVVTRKQLAEPKCARPTATWPARIDRLPLPDYSQFPEMVQRRIRSNYPLLTSRGCPYKCIFCSVPKVSGRKFRSRSPRKIVDELLLVRDKLGVTGFAIIDDVFNLNRKRCKDVCRALIDASLDMEWSCPNGIRADLIDEEMAELFARSGCRSVALGVESGDKEVFERVKKGETLEDIERGIRHLQDHGVTVYGFFIIGLPGDSMQAVKTSLEFIKRTNIGAHFNMLVPYPGTEVYEISVKEGRFLTDNIEDFSHFSSERSFTPVFDTEKFPAEERIRAYQMAHTQVEQFDNLVPKNLPRRTRRMQIFFLNLKYNRKQAVKNFLWKLARNLSFGYLGRHGWKKGPWAKKRRRTTTDAA